MKKTKSIYEAPQLIMEAISTEHGFAGSVFNKDGLQVFYGESVYDHSDSWK